MTKKPDDININDLGPSVDFEIPYTEIQNALTIDRAKTSPNILLQLCQELSIKLKTSSGIAKALVFGNLHSGGTASKASPNHTFNLQYKGKDYFLDLQTIKSIADKISRENNTKFTLRQLARTHEQEILIFASKINLKGNLHKKFLQMNPNIEPDQLIYAADYVDPSNPSIPEEVQKLLIQHKNTTIS